MRYTHLEVGIHIGHTLLKPGIQSDTIITSFGIHSISRTGSEDHHGAKANIVCVPEAVEAPATGMPVPLGQLCAGSGTGFEWGCPGLSPFPCSVRVPAGCPSAGGRGWARSRWRCWGRWGWTPCCWANITGWGAGQQGSGREAQEALQCTSVLSVHSKTRLSVPSRDLL